MANSVVEIEGIQETLKLLNDIDPKFRRLVTKQIKGAGEVILSEARQMVASYDNSKGNGAPLSGMVVYGSKPYRLMTVQSADAAGAIYDHAGANTSSDFVTNLESQSDVGGQPRVIDIAVEKNKPAVQAEVLDVVKQVEKITNTQLKVR